jgi:hypothetical protein
VDRSDEVEKVAKAIVAAFEPKARWGWLSWGCVHLFAKLVNEVSMEQAAAALAKCIEVEE